jgi:16S rRNA (guanine966-N2)-methyltransferase
VRVVAGTHGGRRLVAPPGREVRPTADRVREALFAILGPLEGVRALDLFAGSGALGIEALSRGAASAVFVDRDPRAVRAVRANLSSLSLEATVTRADALGYLRRRAPSGEDRFGLALVDPPYSLAFRLAGPLSELLPAVLLPDARIVTESDSRRPLLLSLPLEDERRYGDTRLAIHRVR